MWSMRDLHLMFSFHSLCGCTNFWLSLCRSVSWPVGLFLLVPIASLLLGGVGFVFGMVYWLYVTVSSATNCIIIAAVTVASGFPLLIWPLMFGVQSLYIVSETSRLCTETAADLGPRCLDGPAISAELERWVIVIGRRQGAGGGFSMCSRSFPSFPSFSSLRSLRFLHSWLSH